MSVDIEYHSSKASESEIDDHLSRCSAQFVPPLDTRVEIREYARKLAAKATTFEAWSGGLLIGLVALYCNDRRGRVAYITSVSVLPDWGGKGIAVCLLTQSVEHARISEMRKISLEVTKENTRAIRTYEKCGFLMPREEASILTMTRYLNRDGDDHGD